MILPSLDVPPIYKCIVADPPWPYTGHIGPSKAHRPNSYSAPLAGANSVKRYGQMGIDDLCAMTVPANEDSHLYLWTTNRFIVESHRIAVAWGFRPITIITWGKIKSDGTPSKKIGHYFRGATEHIVFAVKGSLDVTGRPAESTLLLTGRLPHSSKPKEFFAMVEGQSPGPRLELFARCERLGWDCWGKHFQEFRP